MIAASGVAVLTASSIVGTEAHPIRVFQITILSDGTAGVVTLYDGVDGTGHVYYVPTTTISKSITTVFGEEGILFPNGCYYEADAHAILSNITYRIEEV